MPNPLNAGDRSGIDAWLGRFAMRLRVASTAKLPLLPTERSVTTSLMLVDLDRMGEGGVIQHHRVCDVWVEGSSSAVRTVIPRAFVDGLPDRRYSASLDPAGDKLHYTADLGFEAIGFDPRATGGKLPDGSGDPGIRDTDNDGEPGATVELRVPLVGRVRLFIAQRSHLVLRGAQAGPDRIAGNVDIQVLEQRPLGADPGLFNRTPDLRPDSANSSFTMIRVPDEMGCAGLREAGEALFQ